MNEINPPCPRSVHTRSDAVVLWKHLLARGISFHWEDDPAEWVDASGRPVLDAREATHVRKLVDDVVRLDDERCFADALSLHRLAMLVSPQAAVSVPESDVGHFGDCRSRRSALARLRRARSAS